MNSLKPNRGVYGSLWVPFSGSVQDERLMNHWNIYMDKLHNGQPIWIPCAPENVVFHYTKYTPPPLLLVAQNHRGNDEVLPGISQSANTQGLGTEVQLQQNMPNPFSEETEISYTLPVQALVRLEVTDLYGRVVANLLNESKSAGQHSLRFSAKNLPSGMYRLRLQTFDASGKATLKTVQMSVVH